MSKIIRILIVTLLVSMFLTSTVLADGNCPPGFMLHMAHEHDEHHTGHLHAGTDADRNGDGFICVKHATPSENVHVHIDNNVR